MHAVRKVTDSIVFVGAEDRRLQLFENLFPIERGISYNSYLILDEKTALLDTVDNSVGRQYFENLEFALDGRKLDYLIVNHMEPDHCAMIDDLCRRYPELTLVANDKARRIIDQLCYYRFPDERVILVKEGDTLSLGKHELSFVFAPMVHWPEVMFTYDKTEKVLFSADAFGSFGTNNGNIFNDEQDYTSTVFVDDFRRYYTNIVGKFGVQTQNALKKAAGLAVEMICPLHGPVWRSDLEFALKLYEKWSRYEPEEQALAVFYSSVYGNTESAVNYLVNRLAERGIKRMAVYDVSKTDVSVLIAETFRVSHIVIAATTYNNHVFPKMQTLITDMKDLNVQNKKVALIENGSWAPQSGKLMKAELSAMKNMEFIGETVTIKSAVEDPAVMDALAEEIVASYFA